MTPFGKKNKIKKSDEGGWVVAAREAALVPCPVAGAAGSGGSEDAPAAWGARRAPRRLCTEAESKLLLTGEFGLRDSQGRLVYFSLCAATGAGGERGKKKKGSF